MIPGLLDSAVNIGPEPTKSRNGTANPELRETRATFGLAEFFAARDDLGQIDAVIAHCVITGADLKVSIMDDGGFAQADEPADRLNIHGHWRSPLLNGHYTEPGALLLVPFVFAMREMRFPARMLYTLRRNNRSLADTCMRNYFYAATRGEAIDLVDRRQGGADRASRRLARTYLGIVKDSIDDDALDRDNAAELILASAHASIGALSNPLHQQGALQFRRIAQARQRAIQVSLERVADGADCE
jgi:hypothetical protein